MRCSDRGRRGDDWNANQAEISRRAAMLRPRGGDHGKNRSVFAAVGLPNAVSLPGCRPRRLLVGIIAGFFANPIRKNVERPFPPGFIEGSRGPWVSFRFHASGSKRGWRRGMELNHQIRFCRPFPFLFGFRALMNFLPYEQEGNRFIGKKRHFFSPLVTPGNREEGTFGGPGCFQCVSRENGSEPE
jgi:hypothetical protein